MDVFNEPLTLDPTFGKLGREIVRFANHTQRFVRASRKYRELLTAASVASEGVAPLDRAPSDPVAAMGEVDRFARSRREPRPILVGAYFAHHHLRNQASMCQDLLRESLHPDPHHRVETCHRVYRSAERLRREWVGGFLELTLASAAPDLDPADYAALNVGALTDHEDVDLALVCATPQARSALSKGFSTVAKTFVRFASKIQLFLTEGFIRPAAGATLDEFEQLLHQPHRHVVSKMQLLGAQFLCGNPELERALRERVTQKYFSGRGDHLVHEGFLRSVNSELRVALRHTMGPGVLAPKSEIYVPAKLATTALRVMHGVYAPLVPDALQAIRDAGIEPAATEQLADVFVQTEVLRALVFLYVFQGDRLELSDHGSDAAVRRVALLFGLGESARRMPEARLMGTYMDLRSRSRQAIAPLARSIESHLVRISTFRRLVDAPPPEGGNQALQLLEQLRRHKGSVFWDEVVQLLSDSPDRRKRFVEDFAKLDPEEQRDVARRFIAMMVEDAASLIELLVLLAAHDAQGRPAAERFFRALMDHLSQHPEAVEPFIDGLETETKSETLFRLATAFPPSNVSHLSDFLEAKDDTTRSARVVRSLRSVVYLVHHRSNAMGRVANRVMARSPEFLRRLGDSRRLRELTAEILEQAAGEPDPQGQIELLGDSFDVAFLRASLIAVLEGAPSARDTECTAAVDRYVRELFKACFRDIRARSPMFELYRPGSGIAVFATGGYGRGEAFGSDFDYLAVVHRNDPGLKKFFGKVLQQVCGAMSRRGLHPHNRFTQLFNAWVVSIPELIDHMGRRNEETFIDEAEVTEARFVLGDPSVARQFKDQVQSLALGPSRQPFIRDVLKELRARRVSRMPDMNLKEGAGGLRELNLLFLAIQAYARANVRPDAAGWGPAARSMPEHAVDLQYLVDAHFELRRQRELYRLTVAFDDDVDPAPWVEIARDLAPLRRAAKITDSWGERITIFMKEVADAIDRVAEGLERQLDREAQGSDSP